MLVVEAGVEDHAGFILIAFRQECIAQQHASNDARFSKADSPEIQFNPGVLCLQSWPFTPRPE